MWDHTHYEKITENLSFYYFYFGGGDYIEKLWFNDTKIKGINEYILTKALIENQRLYSNKHVLTKEGRFLQMKILERIYLLLLQERSDFSPFLLSLSYRSFAYYLIENYPNSPAINFYRQSAFEWSLLDFQSNNFVPIGYEFLDDIFASNDYNRAVKYSNAMHEYFGLNRINKYVFEPLYRKAQHWLQVNDSTELKNSIRELENAILDSTNFYCKPCGLLALNKIEFDIAKIKNNQCRMDSLALKIIRENYTPIVELSDLVQGSGEFVTAINVDVLKSTIESKKKELSELNKNKQLLINQLQDTSLALANASANLTVFKSKNKALSDSIDNKKVELSILDSSYTKKAQDYNTLEVRNNWTTIIAIMAAILASTLAYYQRKERNLKVKAYKDLEIEKEEKIIATKDAALYKSNFFKEIINFHPSKSGLPTIIAKLNSLIVDLKFNRIDHDSIVKRTSIIASITNNYNDYITQLLSNSEKVSIPLADEILNCEQFVKFMNSSNDLKVVFKKDNLKELLNIKIPPNILIPFIENCYTHAFDDTDKIKEIEVAIENSDVNNLICNDSGKGISDDVINLKGSGVSLNSLKEYLVNYNILYGTKYYFDPEDKVNCIGNRKINNTIVGSFVKIKNIA